MMKLAAVAILITFLEEKYYGAHGDSTKYSELVNLKLFNPSDFKFFGEKSEK
jgi:hypothetical protein